MLPFLKWAQEGSVSTPPDSIERKPDEDFDIIETVAKELIDAIHSKDVSAVAESLKAAFTLLDSEPHKEGPHD